MIAQNRQRCKFCGTPRTDMWWKCCSDHVTEFGDDVVCSRCQEELHLALPNVSRVWSRTAVLAVILFAAFCFAMFFATLRNIGGL